MITHDYHIDLVSGDQAAISVDKGSMSDQHVADSLASRLSVGRGVLWGKSVDCDDDGYAPFLVIPAEAIACVTIRRRPEADAAAVPDLDGYDPNAAHTWVPAQADPPTTDAPTDPADAPDTGGAVSPPPAPTV